MAAARDAQFSQRASGEQAFGKRRVSCRILASRSGGMADAADSKFKSRVFVSGVFCFASQVL